MRWPSSEVFELVIFCLVALALVFQLSMTVFRLHGNDPQILQLRLERWEQSPKWLISGVLFLVLGIGFVFLGTMTEIKTNRWQQDRKAAEQQKALFLEVHIPSVSPGRIYTVVAKFNVHGRAYNSRPVQTKSGQQKPSYPLTLYYDSKNPSRNSWTRFEIADKRELQQALGYAIGFIFIGILLLDFVEIQLIRRRLAHGSAGSVSCGKKPR